MNALVTEWVIKANGDRFTAKRESEVIDAPNWDACIFARVKIRFFDHNSVTSEHKLPPSFLTKKAL